MAITQLKQGRKYAARNFAGNIRTVGSQAETTLPISWVRQDLAERSSLHLLPVLQTTLDILQLVRLFHGRAKQIVPHQAILYRYPTSGEAISIGELCKHTCTYRLVVEGVLLGEITFSRTQIFSDAEISLLESLVSSLIYPLRNGLIYKAAMEEARRDPLTGVHNRGAMEEALEREVGLARRCRSPLSLIFMDIDYFKAINDNSGHIVGDQVIREFARCADDKVRATDILSRYGGDEFVVILPNTAPKGAEQLASRIRAAVAQSPYLLRIGRDRKITASIGIANLKINEKAQDLLGRADKALASAKQDGRNCIRRAS